MGGRAAAAAGDLLRPAARRLEHGRVHRPFFRTDSAACPAATRHARLRPSSTTTCPELSGRSRPAAPCPGTRRGPPLRPLRGGPAPRPPRPPPRGPGAGRARPPLVPERGGPFLRVRTVVDRRPDPLGLVEDIGPGQVGGALGGTQGRSGA